MSMLSLVIEWYLHLWHLLASATNHIFDLQQRPKTANIQHGIIDKPDNSGIYNKL